jgi:hypothetical protein
MSAGGAPQQTPPFALAFESLAKFKHCRFQAVALEECAATSSMGVVPSNCLSQRHM